MRNWGVAFADTMSILDGRVLATVGLRRQAIHTRTFDYNTGAGLSEFDDNALTPVGALILRPLNWLSLYANYAESLLPGEIAPPIVGGIPIVNAGQALSPFRGEQVEVGVKIDRQTYGATLAFFTLNRPNSIVDSSGVFSAGGEQDSQGIELAFFGEPLPGLRVLGGATFLDSELARTTGGINEGNTPIGIADAQANLNIEWDVPRLPGLTVDGRVTYTDEQYTNNANTFTIPSWTRLDLGARYTTKFAGRALLLSGRIENLLDRDYWASSGGFPGANYLVLGNPRTYLFSASVDF